ncbi:MAG TPA: glycosyltransferase N-terminal domain-containing protein [Caulobacteraceae bacterium]|jgi:3-deoxy-D-manno-octulosonic-acid transferase|nr:glycosyltransferase N-terminal domain-containing protein [Caulobacteraceae bacterium]
MRPPFALLAYRFVTALIEPFAPWLLHRRARRGKEDKGRLGERLGRASVPRPRGTLVWLHGVSVGESLSLLPLVETLRREHPDIGLLVTSGTQTAAALMAQRLPPRVTHQYAPIDGPRAIGRFLDHWRPDLAVFVESELWPNLLTGARLRGTKTALISAKLSDKSLRGWSRAPGLARGLLGGFDLLLAQDQRAADRFEALGVKAHGLADLKFGAEPLPADAAALDALLASLKNRPVLVAASTHEGEEEIVLECFRAALLAWDAAVRDPVLVIVPRHPDRGEAILSMALERDFNAALQSAGDHPGGHEVYVADALGELGLWYRLAHLAVIGGSLCDGLAGHNPLEPARLGCPFISGAHVSNWTTAYIELELAEATRLVADGAALGEALHASLADEEPTRAMARRARAYVTRKDDEARAALTLILGLLR